MSAIRLALVASALAACQFDERGVPNLSTGADSGQIVDTPAVIDAPLPDAYRPDAAIPCEDGDGDTFQVVVVPGADCGELLDCDDSDPNAHPGQEDYFVVPRVAGGFDYNCDGEETPIDTTQGHDCMWDWFWCAGTGWLGPVPACGQEGTYHWCEPDWERCEEAASQTGLMPCR